MRKKSVDQVVVDDGLSKLLKKPNRNYAGAAFMEQLYGYKLLTGESNLWFPSDGKPSEMFIIPKQSLAVVKGADAWTIDRFKILLAGQEVPVEPKRILMWRFANYNFDPIMLTHLRGQSPLDAGLLTMQASNEGAERLVAMNKNQGAAGLVYDKAARDYPTLDQSNNMRRQFNLIVNDSDLAGQIAYLTGDLGYHKFGLDAEQLQLIEQSDASFKTLCNIFDVPWQLFGNSDSYENRKQYKRDFIYDNIAVAAYSLRDELNASLIPLFELDRERDVIDVDVMSLPELAEDLKTQVEALGKLWQLTPNQVLEYLGWDQSKDPNMDKIYIPQSFVPLEHANLELGTSLDKDLNDLEG